MDCVIGIIDGVGVVVDDIGVGVEEILLLLLLVLLLYLVSVIIGNIVLMNIYDLCGILIFFDLI